MVKGGGSNAASTSMRTVLLWTIGVATIALVGLVMLILFGNLSGNVGFAVGSANANLTDNFIGNYTQSVVNTGIQFPVVGTIIGIALLLLVLIGILVFAVRQLTKMDVSGSGGSFG